MKSMNNNVTSYQQPVVAPVATPVASNAPNGSQQPAPVAVAQAPPVSPNVKAVCHGLRSISASIGRVADYLESNPTEASTASESARGIAEHLDSLVAATAESSASNHKLRAAAEDAKKASDWISGNFPTGGSQSAATVANASPFGRVFGSFGELARR